MNKAIFLHVGQRIGSKRRAANMTRHELARRVGITAQQIEAYENAECNIPAAHLWAIAVAQSVPVKYYVEDNEKQETTSDA